ncbi:hypothetical protein OAH90_05095 [Alphaproteobacteria bacterium]|nr:hypothetical protein [Alphaproteobacteria bacterium]
MLKLRSSYPSTPFGGFWTCAFATMKMAATILRITSALALPTRAGFCVALNQRMKLHQPKFSCNRIDRVRIGLISAELVGWFALEDYSIAGWRE